jgi:hypothetical protein
VHIVDASIEVAHMLLGLIGTTYSDGCPILMPLTMLATLRTLRSPARGPIASKNDPSHQERSMITKLGAASALTKGIGGGIKESTRDKFQ